MKNFIKEKLSLEQWSTDQIKGYFNANDIDMVSHERIYQFIWEDIKTNTLYIWISEQATKNTGDIMD